MNAREAQLMITDQDMPRPITEMSLIQDAIQKGDISMVERLVALQERMVARRAEQQYHDAMNKAQAEMSRVAADAENPQTRSKYASYAAIDRIIRPLYTKHGFSLSFNTGESVKPEYLKIICKVSHRGGHTETREVEMPADGKGAKGGDVMTKTHAVGNAMSYGMRYLVKFIFNIAVGQDDHDGNAGGMDVSALQDWLTAITDAASMDELKQHYQAAYSAAKSESDKAAIIRATNARKVELGSKK